MDAPVPGQEVLVDTGAYGLPGENWCRVTHVFQGEATAYPIRVAVPGKGVGQYRLDEVREVRGG